MASHDRCLHFYFAKEGGKKESRMIETNGADPGYCSVCWKIKKTPPELRQKALALLDEYQHRFGERPERWTHYQVELERTFYRWLYYEPDRRKKRVQGAPDESTLTLNTSVSAPPTQDSGSPNSNSGQGTELCDTEETTQSQSEVPARRWETAGN